MPDVLIAPSVLAADLSYLADQVGAAEAAGADWIHVDVMDGRFVPNLSFGSLIVEAVRRATTLPVDVHLMIEAPERTIDAYANAGADGITVHAEATPHPHRALERIERLRAARDGAGAACLIQVDGGIGTATAAGAVRAGADVLVAGSAVFDGTDPGTRLRGLRTAVAG